MNILGESPHVEDQFGSARVNLQSSNLGRALLDVDEMSDISNNEMVQETESKEENVQFPTQTEIKEAEMFLDSIGQYAVNNVYVDLDLGAGINEEFGVFSATLCDIMHTLKSGVLRYICTVFFSLMTGGQRAMFDFVLHQVFRASRQTVFSYSSKHGYPCTSFPNGVSNLTHVTANEWVGIAFICASLCVTIRGQLIFSDQMDKKWNQLVKDFWNKKKQE